MENKYAGLICRGSYFFGTACGKCEKCRDDKEMMRPSPSTPSKCEHDHGDYGWQNPRKINGHFTFVPKKDEAECPFCPAPKEKEDDYKPCNPKALCGEGIHGPGCPNAEVPKEKEDRKITVFYSSEDKGMIAKYKTFSGFGENSGQALKELATALAGALEAEISDRPSKQESEAVRTVEELAEEIIKPFIKNENHPESGENYTYLAGDYEELWQRIEDALRHERERKG